MPNVYKSMPVEVLDGFFDNGPDLADNLRFSLGLLEGNQSLKTITEGLGSEHPEFGNVSEQADDFEDFWLEPLSNQGVERVMRRAYRHAGPTRGRRRESRGNQPHRAAAEPAQTDRDILDHRRGQRVRDARLQDGPCNGSRSS